LVRFLFFFFFFFWRSVFSFLPFLFRFCWATFLPSRGSGARTRSLFQIMNKNAAFLHRWLLFLALFTAKVVLFAIFFRVSRHFFPTLSC
jgi:hypothetical protein